MQDIKKEREDLIDQLDELRTQLADKDRKLVEVEKQLHEEETRRGEDKHSTVLNQSGDERVGQLEKQLLAEKRNFMEFAKDKEKIIAYLQYDIEVENGKRIG